MDSVIRAAEWAGWPLDQAQREALSRLAEWLEREAIPAGGLGPGEATRLFPRHIADSLLFAGGWRPPEPPASLVDLGSGVGLPGLPLAILWPRTRVTLLDRAGRRTQLARRARRILALDNVAVEEADAGAWSGGPYSMVVARAAAEPATVTGWAQRLVAPDGVIVVGGSWESPPDSADTLVVPPEVLDREIWLRKIAPA